MAGTTRLYHQGSNYQDEFVKTLEEEYCIKIDPKSEHDSSMGGVLQKMKSWKPQPDMSPAKSDKSLSPSNKHSPCERYPVNGTHFTYEKAKLKALSQKKVEKNLKFMHKDSAVSNKIKKRRVKRKHGDDELSDTRPKRRRLNPLNNKVANHFEGGNGLTCLSAGVQDAREIIEARRARRLENVKMVTQKDKLANKEEIFADKQQSKEKLKVHCTQRVRSNLNLLNNSSKVDSSYIKVLDQNLNHVTDCVNTDNLKEIYSKKLQEVNDLSPFKGQMSAFEISLLKGKQNLERRKSIESATLRSSPRMNANVPKPNYREKKRNKSRLSLASSLDRHAEKLSRIERLSAKRERKRTRTAENVGSYSPSSEENKVITPVPKKRKSKAKIKNSDNLDSEISFNYRSVSSPKLKTLPSRLSLEHLSAGTSDIYQGSAFTSLQKHNTANKISGNSAAAESHSPDFIKSDSKLPYCFNKPLEHPKTLPVETINIFKKTEDQFINKASVTARNKTEVVNKNKGKKSLEETVNMLRRNSSAKCKEISHGKLSLTPSRSDSRTSRRSSRSSTPNMSPIKSEILTPNSTPCSSPSKSPCTTPVCYGGGTKLKKTSKKKKYLFSRNDEVLARWHDGLYYLGNILRIDDRSKKCLLRYEDNSEYWSLFKDIHRVLKEEEMTCCICLSDVSEPPNEIVLCEYCLQGFHQQCHNPNIGSGKIVDPDEPWYCRRCVFFLISSGAGKTDKELQLDDEMRRMKLALPYNLETLTWDQQHKNNIEATYCYCGGPGIWYQKMLQCCRCKQWFHEACMQCLDYHLLYADSFYIFVCSPCNAGKEYVKRLDVDWADLVHIGLFNLAVQEKRKYFDLDTEIMPWLLDNWDQLQVNKYIDLTEDEKEVEVRNALELNKTRFSNGLEIRKKTGLWGLRVRVPPPRIHITLPFKGQVNDELMNKLKIKGRRSKVFMPVECKSPVNRLHYSPLHARGSAKKRLDSAALEQGEVKYSPSKQAFSQPKQSRKHRQLTFLEELIPSDDSLIGCNHPFKTELEQSAEKAEEKMRAEIWNKFLATFDNNDDNYETESNTANSDCVHDGPPVLEKVEPVVPTLCNGTPPMPEIQEKRQSRKSVPKLEKNNDKRSRDRHRRRISCQLPVSETSDEFVVKHIRSVAGGNYYCCHDKTGYGRGFSVMGRRMNSVGRVEYMVKWD